MSSYKLKRGKEKGLDLLDLWFNFYVFKCFAGLSGQIFKCRVAFFTCHMGLKRNEKKIPCQDSQIKVFLCFELKGGWKREGDYDHKTAFIWEPWLFRHMLDKIKSFLYGKNTNFILYEPFPFARFLRDTLSITFKMHKKGRGQKK